MTLTYLLSNLIVIPTEEGRNQRTVAYQENLPALQAHRGQFRFPSSLQLEAECSHHLPPSHSGMWK